MLLVFFIWTCLSVGYNDLNDQRVALKFVPLIIVFVRMDSVCLKEPQKSNAPQLKDEYRTYRLLTGSRTMTCQSIMINKYVGSWDTDHLLVRAGVRVQRAGDGAAWAESGGGF